MTEQPDGWAVASVDDVADVLDSRRVPVNRKERALRPGNIPYYGATGQVGWIDSPLFDEELCLVGEDGAPFLDRDKPKAYLIDGPSWVNNHAHVLRARTITSNRYLKYVLDFADYRPVVNGTTRLKLTRSGLSQIPIPLPPLGEQRRIVAAIEERLSRLDAAERSLEAARRRAGSIRAALLDSAATYEPTVELGALVTDLRYGTSAKCDYAGAGAPVLRIPNVQRGSIDTSDLKYAVDVSLDLRLHTVTEGDVLFVRTNGSRNLIGRAAAVERVDPGTAFASYLIRARLDLTGASPTFVSLIMAAPSQRARIERLAATSAGQYNLNLKSLRSLPVPDLQLEEQHRIVAEVEQQLSLIDSLRAAVESAQKRSAALRHAILERAFRGELVPQDPDDEPASVLLERIRAERAS